MNRTRPNVGPRWKMSLAAILALGSFNLSAQIAFSPPEGGWNYIYEGDKAAYAENGEGFMSLDGTWSHDNGSDQWDGSGIGGDFGDDNRPGGAQIITEGDTTYLRIQDTGDPRDYGYSDPGSNRKVYLGHDLTAEEASETIMDDGVTLIFRARIPTDGPLDILHPNGQQDNGTQPYPEGGDGYVTSDGGKGNFVIKQASGGAIAFSLTTATDTPNGNPNEGVTNFAGLSMNEFAGNEITGNVNFGQGDGQNVVPFDPTQWHEFWITIEKDPLNEGTHITSIYLDGATQPTVFKMTAGPGDDFGGISYLAMGATATPQNAALDIDFFGVKYGVVRPAAKSFATPEGGWNYSYEGDAAAYAENGEGFMSLDGTWSHDNGSDQWDGSAIGGDFGDDNRPGGAQIITEGSTDYLRIQDTGDPRDYGFSDPGSNRKVYLGHDLTADGASETVLDEGVTLSFRARVPVNGPLDVLHPNGQQDNGTQPYPENGDGYVTSDGGKGNFVIKQAAGGAIAFSLTTATDTPNGNPNEGVTNFAGLSMNEFAGNQITGNVNFGQGDGQNVVPFDPTQWHEFWITLEKDPAEVGTHLASIYVDGNTSPQVFKMTAGPGDDFSGISYIAMGATATPQNAALDIDFFRVKFAAVAPEGAVDAPPPNFGNLSPALGANFVSASEGVKFTATSEVGIQRENISLTLNGSDFTGDLELNGDNSSWEVSLPSLQDNLIYLGELRIVDDNGIAITGVVSFNTFATDNLTIEAEDFNFDNGEFIDNPALQGNNSFFDKGGSVDSEGVDFHELSDEFNFDNEDAWRFPLDGNMPNTVSNDNEAGRARYEADPALDYSVNGTQEGEWLNYTRTFSVGSANVYLRATDGNTFVVQLDRVTGNASRANQDLEKLGEFRGDRGGYDWVALTDDNGQLAAVELDGEATIRATIVQGSPDLNFIMVAPAVEVATPEPPAPPVVVPPVVLPPVPGGDVTPTISITRNADGTVTVEFEGVLQAAENVEGPYVDVAAESPLTIPASEVMQFARARRP